MTRALIIEDGEHAWAVDADSARVALNELGWSIERRVSALRVTRPEGTEPAEAYGSLMDSLCTLQDDPATYCQEELEYEGYADADTMSTDSGAWLLHSNDLSWWLGYEA